MSTYSYSVSTKPGLAPDDSKAHHVKNKKLSLKTHFRPTGSEGIARYLAQGKLPVSDTSKADIPTTRSFLPSRTAGNSFLRATWLGHACYYVEFPSGFRALLDAVFEERFNRMGPKRFTSAACGPEDLLGLDAIFISHDHHDHLSYPTVEDLVCVHPNVQFFVGIRLAKWFQESGVGAVMEMDWWDDAEVILERKAANANPGNDTDPERLSVQVSYYTLWASWAVTSGAKSVWFAGDTGYRFLTLRGSFNLGLIPISAYQPRMMCSPVHASPYDAVEIFQDTKCKATLAMHWGTWALTSEPVNELPRKLREALKVKGLPETGLFDVCAIGESRKF
ncbi:beta-lactamase superfamily domain-containing protein [Annulohypoxylon bovei var. microspora]|nr:beta-lactamase superfamily domain-containing protein [Annulohypoxylon bovei var. microspora]